MKNRIEIEKNAKKTLSSLKLTVKTTGQKLWSNYSVKECLLKKVPFSRTHFLFLWLIKFLAIFKDCVCYFLYFTKGKPLKNYGICILSHLKCSFRCKDIQIFVIFLVLSIVLKFEEAVEYGASMTSSNTCINYQL